MSSASRKQSPQPNLQAAANPPQNHLLHRKILVIALNLSCTEQPKASLVVSIWLVKFLETFYWGVGSS